MFWNFDQDKDTFANFLNNPQVQNSYSYANGNPVNNSDPKGKWSQGQIEGANYLYENSQVARYAMNHPWRTGAIVGIGGGLLADVVTGGAAIATVVNFVKSIGSVCLVFCEKGEEIPKVQEVVNKATSLVQKLDIDTRPIRSVKDIEGFTDHGLNQVINNNVTPEKIIDTIKNTTQYQYRVDVLGRESFRYIGEKAVLNFNKANELITAWSRSY